MPLRQAVHSSLIRSLPRSFRGCLRYSTASLEDSGRIGTAGTPDPGEPSREPNTSSSNDRKSEDEPESALARRFSSLAENAVITSPSNAQKLAQEDANSAAISEELKDALQARIAAAEFNSVHAQSISIANLPGSASKHTRDIASARVWTGVESTEDAVLRMLVDSHKPLKMKPTIQQPTPRDTNVDLRPKNTFAPKLPGGARLAVAKDKTLGYTVSKDAGLTEEEREQVRQMFRDRFHPEARVATVQALMSLADKRIEDARARGQFKEVWKLRGKPLERDYNASSPFLDTTEYYLNKMIQRQEMLPPWVEKQQELKMAADRFRTRLRNDWRRFVARRISSKGGTVEEQCRHADELSKGEARRVQIERIEKKLQYGEDLSEEELAAREAGGPAQVFRDADWEKAELSYNKVAIDDLNRLTTDYNLMAPEVSRKPLFSLDRELSRCFADVAPQVSAEIRGRAKRPTGGFTPRDGASNSFVSKLAGEGRHTAVIYDSKKPNYGFKELWKDLFGKEQTMK